MQKKIEQQLHLEHRIACMQLRTIIRSLSGSYWFAHAHESIAPVSDLFNNINKRPGKVCVDA